MQNNGMILFEEVAQALKDINFGEDLSLIISEAPGKPEMTILAESAIQEINNSGKYDPLRELFIVKRLAFYLLEIEKGIKFKATEEAEKYTNNKRGKFELFGGQVHVQAERSTYEYPEGVFEDIDKHMQILKDMRKAREKLLQMQNYIDSETGIEYPQAKKLKGDGNTIALTL